jgi:hypothetical protein
MIRVKSPGGEGIVLDFAPGRVLVSIRGWQIWYPADKCHISYRDWKIVVNFRGCLGIVCPQNKRTFWTIVPHTPKQCQDFIDRYCTNTSLVEPYTEATTAQLHEKIS